MAYVMSARWTAVPGREEQLLEALRTVMEESRREPGTQLYEVARRVDDPRVFLLFEAYDDESAYRAHGAAERFRTEEFRRLIADCVESREREFYETIG